MNKREIRSEIKTIIEAINIFRNNLDDVLVPYESIKTKLEEIQGLEEQYGVECNIDYEETLDTLLASCIDNSEYIADISEKFDMLISDIECWQEDVSERKYDEIQEEYLDVLSEIKYLLDSNEATCKDDIEDTLADMINQLEEI